MCKSMRHLQSLQSSDSGSCIFSNYLSTLKQPNVETVTSPVERFTEHEFVTADGKSHEVDVVIMATGYDVVRTVAILVKGAKQLIRYAPFRLPVHWTSQAETEYEPVPPSWQMIRLEDIMG